MHTKTKVNPMSEPTLSPTQLRYKIERYKSMGLGVQAQQLNSLLRALES
jgi:hypothetical protein